MTTKNEPQSTASGRSADKGVRAVDRAIAIMKSFSVEDPELTLTEISERVGLNKATAFRFLHSLEAGGFVARVNRRKSFRLGPALTQLASLSLEKFDLREVARPEMLALAKQFGASVHLGILEGNSVVYVEKVEPTAGMLQVKTRVGGRRPLHSTALGKVLLADLPPDEADRLMEQSPLVQFTSKTIGSISKLREELATVRRQGFAIDDGESNEFVCCFAVPLRGAGNETLCALSVTMVGVGANTDQFAESREQTIEAGRRISKDLAVMGA